MSKSAVITSWSRIDIHEISKDLSTVAFGRGWIYRFNRFIVMQGLTAAFAQEDLEKAQTLTTLLRYVTRIQTAILQKL